MGFSGCKGGCEYRGIREGLVYKGCKGGFRRLRDVISGVRNSLGSVREVLSM